MPANSRTDMKEKFFALFEQQIDAFNATCIGEGKYGEISESVYNQILGQISLADAIGLVSHETADGLFLRLQRRQAAWRMIFTNKSILRRTKDAFDAALDEVNLTNNNYLEAKLGSII